MKDNDTASQLRELSQRVDQLIGLCKKLDERYQAMQTEAAELKKLHKDLFLQQEEVKQRVKQLLEKSRRLEKNL